MADINLQYSAAFSWDEKGRATLRSFTCRCGKDVVSGPNEVREVTEDFDLTCPECDRTYYAEFLLKLVPYEDDKDRASPGEGELHETPADLVHSGADGEQVAFRYESSVSKNTKEVRGELVNTESQSATVKTDEDESHGQPGDEFTVYTSKSASRDDGVVTKNSRKVGEFEEAEEL